MGCGPVSSGKQCDERNVKRPAGSSELDVLLSLRREMKLISPEQNLTSFLVLQVLVTAEALRDPLSGFQGAHAASAVRATFIVRLSGGGERLSSAAWILNFGVSQSQQHLTAVSVHPWIQASMVSHVTGEGTFPQGSHVR